MSEPQEFLDEILPRQVEAETALHNGDVEPRLEVWTRQGPVTLLGAFGVAASGTSEVSEVSRFVASRFADCTAYSFDLIAAGVSGDLAYTVGTNAPRGPSTAILRPTAWFVPPTSTGERTESGKSSIATGTDSRQSLSRP